MKRILIGAVLGAIVLFVWGAVYWTFLNMMVSPPNHMEDEDAVVEVLRANLSETGAYWLPDIPKLNPDMQPDDIRVAMEGWTTRKEAGPVGIIMYQAEGAAMTASVFAIGFLFDFIIALIASWYAFSVGGGFGKRLLSVLGLGVFLIFANHLMHWNFMNTPNDFTKILLVDSLVGWVLAGLVIAAVVKPKAVNPVSVPAT